MRSLHTSHSAQAVGQTRTVRACGLTIYCSRNGTANVNNIEWISFAFFFVFNFLQCHASQCEAMCVIASIIVSSEMVKKRDFECSIFTRFSRRILALFSVCGIVYGKKCSGSTAHRTHSPINYINVEQTTKNRSDEEFTHLSRPQHQRSK